MTRVDTYDFKELAFECVFPALALQLFSDLENLVYSAGYHAHGLLCLYDDILGRLDGRILKGHSPILLP